MTSEPVLVVDELAVSYGPIRAVQSCSLSVGENETVAIVGANGAGKTSVLRAISGLVPAASGTIRFRGALIANVTPDRLARLGMLHLPEGRGTLPSLTVLENLRLAFARQPTMRPFKTALEEVFSEFPWLRERAGQAAGNLSGGEQQMLALARAFVNPPRLLIVDEPSLGLSPLMVKEAYRALAAYSRRGMAMLIVEQNVHQVLAISSRAYLLRQGEIAYHGRAANLREDPNFFEQYFFHPVNP